MQAIPIGIRPVVDSRMKFRQQTAVEGLFTAAVLNLGGRAIGFARHVAITAYIGLTSGLDAFYVAMSIFGIFILVFSDVFDSLGIPSLVRAEEKDGDRGFTRTAGTIFWISIALSLSLAALMLLSSPWSPWIAAGFAAENKMVVSRHLWLLLPMSVCYLPYHALGSFFRARRRFQAFYIAEFLVSCIGLLVLFLRPWDYFIVPIAWSTSYVGGFLLLYGAYRMSFGPLGAPDREIRNDFLAMGLRLLPLYGAAHLFIVADRYFASFLPSGSVAALSYGLMLCLLLPGILNMENVFTTPLSESKDQGELLEWILKGILLLSIPVMAFTFRYAVPLVQAFFERGAFDPVSSSMTATALFYYMLALPAFLSVSIGIRVFMIRRRMNSVSVLAFCGVMLNVILNYWFTMKAGMGIKGIALATAVTNYALAISFLLFLNAETPIRGEEYLSGILLPSVLCSVLALVFSAFLPDLENRIADVGVRGIAFVTAYAAMIKFLPIPELRRMENIVFRAFFRREEATS